MVFVYSANFAKLKNFMFINYNYVFISFNTLYIGSHLSKKWLKKRARCFYVIKRPVVSLKYSSDLNWLRVESFD